MTNPKHCAILGILTEEILSGRYAAPGSFKGSLWMSRRFGVARQTMRGVLDDLEAQGFIRRRSGKRTQVYAKASGRHPKIAVMGTGGATDEVFRTISVELERMAHPSSVEIVRVCAAERNGGAAWRNTYAMARRLIASGIRGVILRLTQETSECEVRNRRLVDLFRSAGVQVVLVGSDIVRTPRRSDFDLVGIDEFGAGRTIAEHVVASGAKKITFVARRGCSSAVLERLSGVQTVKGRAPVEVMALNSLSDLRQIAQALMNLGQLDTLVCQDDLAAANVATVLRKMGVQVPSQVMLVGFDDFRQTKNHCPGITTVRHPCAEIARHSLRVMLDRLDHPEMSPIRILCREILVPRGSTDRNWKCRI